MDPSVSLSRSILLVVSGGIAAYKTPDLVRRLREKGHKVQCVLTKAAAQFVTPLSLAAVSGNPVYQNLFDLNDETEMGHIQLSRSADLIVVVPASADLMAKAAHGLADDLASTTLLATDTPVMMVPAMNVRMWDHPATQSNVATLQQRGVTMVGPVEGDMACGEYGFGRMSDVPDIVDAIQGALSGGPLQGKTALVTSGPTHEPIDPVRYIANRSSGKQGHAIACALRDLGCAVTLVSGPTALPTPTGMTVVPVESAQEMLAACQQALPADIAVCAAAVADWRVASAADQKMKKQDSGDLPSLVFAENPDILATLAQAAENRPTLVVGFAAETHDVLTYAQAKRQKKGCDWIVANDVSPETGTFGGDDNSVHLVTEAGVESWPRQSKGAVAQTLAQRICAVFQDVEGK